MVCKYYVTFIVMYDMILSLPTPTWYFKIFTIVITMK